MEIKLNGTQIKMLELIRNKPYCTEELSKSLVFSYNYIQHKLTQMKDQELISEIKDNSDGRRKNLILTKKGILVLKTIQTKKSMIAKFDVWLEERFRLVGIEFDKKFNI